MSKLSGLKPEKVFYYFEKLCSIPHGSGNTKQISDYLASFAKENNLKFIQDELNNIIIFADGTEGYKDHEPVILQGHMDMVCEKDEDCTIDMATEGPDVTHDNEVVYAHGTTLGGDDGIAVAYCLAVLSDNTIPHPPLEVIFTVDEETGMEGATGIDLSSLKGKKFINIDSEDEGIFTVSCAGGARSTIHMPISHQTIKNPFVKISIDGLTGGHSGVEIHKNLANANKALGELLANIMRARPCYLFSIGGGAKDNAIPRSAEAVISQNLGLDVLNDIATVFIKEIQHKYEEPNITIKIESVGAGERSVLDLDSTEKVISLINSVPNGIQSWSMDIEGLVQTSLNLGVMKMDENELSLTFAVRSSVTDEKTALIGKLKNLADACEGTYTQKGDYPAWEYRKDSPLRDIFVATYKDMFKKEPKVEAIHAGLECGLISEKINDLDCISFGPQLHDVHTSRETLEIASAERTYNLLLEVLKRL